MSGMSQHGKAAAWRLVDSDLREPAFTVAADEAIAIARSGGLVPNTLHFYRRGRPTISLGYFQKVEEAVETDFCREHDIRIVRRVSGGSAIYTDPGHLIYGLILGGDDLPADRNLAFEMVCRGIVLALESLGLDNVEFRPVNDVLVSGRKISGSAQMRRHGVILQHGTLVLENDPDMMAGALRMDLEKIRSRGHGPGDYVISLAEALGETPDISAVKNALARGFGEVLGAEWLGSGLIPQEMETIRRLISGKYGRDEWNLSR